MNASLAIVPLSREPSLPDITWIKKNVPILAVARALEIPIRHRRTNCWRPENHAHGDANPSLHLYERGNRVRCFVCDLRGSNVDLVMGILGTECGDAVRWIAERFPVPNVKPGRPPGHRAKQPRPYRTGVHGSEFEVLVRSGMFGQFSPAESRIVVTLAVCRDPDSGITQLSYQAIMRYSGVASRTNVSRALRQLQRLHAIQIIRGSRIGITRECSRYGITLEDPKFLERCNELYRNVQQQIEQERTYRAELRAQREEKAREARQEKRGQQVVKGNANAIAPNREVWLSTTEAGGLRPPDHPYSSFPPLQRKTNTQENTPTCEGLYLSSCKELHSNKSVPTKNRKIGVSSVSSESETLRWQMLQRQAAEIKAKYGVPTHSLKSESSGERDGRAGA